ncbi:SCP2 sterol-binding domain-containing protein [Polymorphospora sp. NPDC050346]|uniref:SCP2 sterol-binding domain-containing protein n=1 Tax=Polymorphospora sp. NPDC050346 TaxID=3155780 RepID=UPI0033DC12E6
MGATEAFFEELGQRETGEVPSYVTGTIRFDLHHDEEVDAWNVTFKRGIVFVSRHVCGEPDCVVITDRGTFEGMTTGQINAAGAVLRNEIVFTGQLTLFLYFQRLLPGPPGSHDPRPPRVRELRPPAVAELRTAAAGRPNR